jgi:hypothetical protein
MTLLKFFSNQFLAHPNDAITDFLLSGLCIACYFKFSQLEKGSSIFFWKWFFLVMGLSTLAGGFSHALYSGNKSTDAIILWLFMQILSGLSVCFAQMASILSFALIKIKNSDSQKLGLRIFKIQFVLFTLLTLYFQNFLVVVINSAIGFLIVLYLQLKAGHNNKNFSAYWIAGGIFISFITAYIYSKKISLGNDFSFITISHLILMVSILLIFIGVNNQSMSNLNIDKKLV